MVTTVIKGGLGNQLFQYASAYALSRRLNQTLALDISFFPTQTLRDYKLDKLLIGSEATTVSKESIGASIVKNRYVNHLVRKSKFLRKIYIGNKTTYLIELAGRFAPYFFEIDSENVFMNGYFQSEDYFKSYRSDILHSFVPAYEPEHEFMAVLDEIRSCNSVALHLRHGDFTMGNRSGYSYILGKSYYQNAVDQIKSKVQNPMFFCFSDDMDWVKQNFGEKENFRFVNLHTAHADIDEMMLMKNCKHIITANSTFSWWASWLNENEDALHICPAKRYGNLHMIPENWIKIAVE